jgi:hypothetical protein
MLQIPFHHAESQCLRTSLAPLRPSSFSVNRLPSSLTGFFLQGRINDGACHLTIFPDVTINLTHRSSSYRFDVNRLYSLYTAKRQISSKGGDGGASQPGPKKEMGEEMGSEKKWGLA